MLKEETKRAIYEDYINPANKVADIAEKYGCLRAIVTKIAIEQGAGGVGVLYCCC